MTQRQQGGLLLLWLPLLPQHLPHALQAAMLQQL
jgi:hypothetical protein